MAGSLTVAALKTRHRRATRVSKWPFPHVITLTRWYWLVDGSQANPYNSASRRASLTNADNSRWAYRYNGLGRSLQESGTGPMDPLWQASILNEILRSLAWTLIIPASLVTPQGSQHIANPLIVDAILGAVLFSAVAAFWHFIVKGSREDKN